MFKGIRIPNSICFAPGGDLAYFANSLSGQIMKQALDPKTGWPVGDPEVFVDLGQNGVVPDGSVVDRDGVLWHAQWGGSRVVAYRPDGSILTAAERPRATGDYQAWRPD